MTKYIKDKNGKFAGSIGEGKTTTPSGPPMPPPQRIRNQPNYVTPTVTEQFEVYQKHYFAQDGNYGDADTLTVVDTSRWTNDDWDEIDEAPDYDRTRIARLIAARHDSDPASVTTELDGDVDS